MENTFQNTAEPWLLEEQRQRKTDAWLASRPVCVECGWPIVEERALPWDGGLLCPDCIEIQMVWIEE